MCHFPWKAEIGKTRNGHRDLTGVQDRTLFSLFRMFMFICVLQSCKPHSGKIGPIGHGMGVGGRPGTLGPSGCLPRGPQDVANLTVGCF